MHGFAGRTGRITNPAPQRHAGVPGSAIGTGDGVTRTFAAATCASGPGQYWRPIAKPVEGSVWASIGISNWSPVWISRSMGGHRHLYRAARGRRQADRGFEFDVPVRFDTDRIAVSVASFQGGRPAAGAGGGGAAMTETIARAWAVTRATAWCWALPTTTWRCVSRGSSFGPTAG